MAARVALGIRVHDVTHGTFFVGRLGKSIARDGPVKMRFQTGLTSGQMIQLHVIQADFFHLLLYVWYTSYCTALTGLISNKFSNSP